MPYMGELPEQQGLDYPTYKIRSSYTGKKGRPKYYKDGKNINIPYGLNLLSTYDREKPLYITEGETDMVTLLQAGYQVLGIPGSNAFKEDFKYILDSFGVIIVVLDNDEAGKHLLDDMRACLKEDVVKLLFVTMPEGIKDINTFHCKKCLGSIDKFKEEFNRLQPVPVTLEGFNMLVESFPDVSVVTEYNISNYIKYVIGDDKIEIDKFVKALYKMQGKAQGINTSTIRDVAKQATQALIRESEAAQEELVASLGDKLLAQEEDCYVYKRITTQGVSLEPFTSFTVDILRREINDDTGEITALWRLTSRDDKQEEVVIGPAERASGSRFTEVISKQDGFMYRIPPIAGFHNLFMYFIESNTHCPLVHVSGVVGKFKDKWLFDEYGIDKSGKIVPLENDSYNLDGENFVPPVDAMPKDLYRKRVAMALPHKIEAEEVASLLNTLEINQGSKIAWIILGWISACFIKDKVQQAGWGFPVCYVTGNAQSGKTTLAKWMMKTAGFKDSTAFGARSTVFGINKISSIYSNLPLWFDDIRSLGEDGIWNSVILGAYENSGDVKGTKTMGINMNIEYKSGMFITSEFFVKSPAAQSRCLQLVVDSSMQVRSVFSELNYEVDKVLPYLGANTIVKMQGDTGGFMEIARMYKERLQKRGLGARFAQNYAIVMAGFCMMFSEYSVALGDKMKEFEDFVVEIGTENNLETASNSYAMELVKDIGAILLDRVYKDYYKCGEDWIIKNDKLLLRTSQLYDIWRRYKGVNNTGDYNTRREFIAQLRRLEFAKRNTAGTARIGEKMVPVICWDLEEMEKSQDLEIQTLPSLLRDVDTSEFF